MPERRSSERARVAPTSAPAVVLAWRLLGWLLLSVLLLDRISLPLHPHGHDGNSAFPTFQASAACSIESEPMTGASHAAVALREPTRQWEEMEASEETDRVRPASPHVSAMQVARLADALTVRLERARPRAPSHPGMPPEGRAPPASA